MRSYGKILALLMIILAVGLAACGNDAEIPVEPQELVNKAATSVDEAKSFRLVLEQSGPPTVLIAEISPDLIFQLELNRAEAHVVSPDKMGGTVSVSIEAVTQEIEISVISERQYVKNAILTGGGWLPLTFAPDFMPQDLQSVENGIGAALRSVENLELVGREDIAGGIPVYHLRGTVPATKIRSVTVGLILVNEGNVDIDLYIRRDSTNRLARIVIKEPIESSEDMRIWTIDFNLYNQQFDIVDPDAE